jgi:glutathione reductase (NADPH)
LSESFDYDLFVIGAGSGGVRAARLAAGFGARVAVAEERYLGGTCVNVGCVPKKLFYYASHYHEDFNAARGFGWDSQQPAFDWNQLRDNKTAEIERLNGVYRNLLEGAGVTIFPSRATVEDEHTVSVAGDSLRCRYILLATGGWPFVPEFPGAQHAITSNELFYLDTLPEKAVVVGGGYIAVEFAGILKGLGVETELVYRGPLFLRHFDNDVRETVAEEMRKKGIKLRFDTIVDAIARQEDGSLRVQLHDGNTLQTGLVLYATGRKPHIQDLGLEAVDVRLTKSGKIAVNSFYQTDEPSIYAVGDIIEGPELTPVALAEGTVVANHLFNQRSVALDYSNIATAVFCQPNIGTVGLTETEARKQYSDIAIYKSSFRHLKHTLSGSDEKTFMKLIVNRANDHVVGVHMVGAEAGEIIQGMAVALKCGATKAQFDATIGIHPTAAEEFVTMREPVS